MTSQLLADSLETEIGFDPNTRILYYLYSVKYLLGQKITQLVRWPLFCHCRANAVEQSVRTASATRHHLRTIQTIVENIYVWLVESRRLVSER